MSGWAWNPQEPNTPINVDVYSDGVLLNSVPANQFRQDLRNAGIGNGVHGFSFATPNSLKNLATQPPVGVYLAMLLTDGSVMAQASMALAARTKQLR